jgi:hypothetical protein
LNDSTDPQPKYHDPFTLDGVALKSFDITKHGEMTLDILYKTEKRYIRRMTENGDSFFAANHDWSLSLVCITIV